MPPRKHNAGAWDALLLIPVREQKGTCARCGRLKAEHYDSEDRWIRCDRLAPKR